MSQHAEHVKAYDSTGRGDNEAIRDDFIAIIMRKLVCFMKDNNLLKDNRYRALKLRREYRVEDEDSEAEFHAPCQFVATYTRYSEPVLHLIIAEVSRDNICACC